MIHIGEDMDPRVRSACADNLSLKMLALDMLAPALPVRISTTRW